MSKKVIMVLYSKDFAKAFSNLLVKTGASCYQIHQFTHLDQAYLSRLKSGEQNNPSIETIIKISLAICHLSDKIQLHDIEHLLNSTGRSLRVYD